MEEVRSAREGSSHYSKGPPLAKQMPRVQCTLGAIIRTPPERHTTFFMLMLQQPTEPGPCLGPPEVFNCSTLEEAGFKSSHNHTQGGQPSANHTQSPGSLWEGKNSPCSAESFVSEFSHESQMPWGA